MDVRKPAQCSGGHSCEDSRLASSRSFLNASRISEHRQSATGVTSDVTVCVLITGPIHIDKSVFLFQILVTVKIKHNVLFALILRPSF